MRRLKLLLMLSVAVIISNDVLACGESLYRVGRGVLYREYTAPLPGRILIVAQTEAENAMAERIAAAGHDVHIVSRPDAIRGEISDSDHSFDLVLAYFNQRAEVEAQTASISISYLPVILDEAEEGQAEAMYGRHIADQASVKQFLRAIHSVLRAEA
jgi:hypothetical protein